MGETTAGGLGTGWVRHRQHLPLDSLDRASYFTTTRRDLLPKLMGGIDAAR